MGTTIAILAEDGDDLSGASDLAAEAESSPPPKTEESAPPPPPSSEPKKESKKESKPAESAKSTKEELKTGDRIFASPIAKKIALEKGIPLGQVKGTGPDGRIVRADVESYKASGASASTSSATSAPESAYTDTPISNMRRTIAGRLTQSKQELPHYYVTVDIDMGRALKLREVFNKALAEKDSETKAKLSVNDFIVKASALALRDVPEVNSAWLGETIRQ